MKRRVKKNLKIKKNKLKIIKIIENENNRIKWNNHFQSIL